MRNIWHTWPDGTVVDSNGISMSKHRAALERLQDELAYLIGHYDEAEELDYGIAGAMRERIDACRSAIYWTERHIAQE